MEDPDQGVRLNSNEMVVMAILKYMYLFYIWLDSLIFQAAKWLWKLKITGIAVST